MLIYLYKEDIMKVIIRGEKVAVTKAIDEFIKEKLAKLDKYFDNPDILTANVLIKIRKDGHKVEVTIPTGKYIVRVEEKEKMYMLRLM